ncbi:L-rhamnose mutarotase [Sesbania bispinosa]|nr:L-rhamnose mutarotase [Sesbania bispinosa]
MTEDGNRRRHDGCGGGLKRLLTGERRYYMYKDNDMTVMMAVRLRKGTIQL